MFLYLFRYSIDIHSNLIELIFYNNQDNKKKPEELLVSQNAKQNSKVSSNLYLKQYLLKAHSVVNLHQFLSI